MRNRKTLVLMTVFFAGLVAMWWAGRAGVQTAAERLRVEGLILPGLSLVEPASIRHIEVVGADSTIVVERDGASRWRLIEPVRSLAEGSRVDALVEALARLRRFEDAAPIEVDEPERFGFKAIGKVLRVSGQGGNPPLVALELGDVVGDRRYVRVEGQSAIEAVPAELLDVVDLPATSWRERSLLDAYAYDVAAIEVTGPDRDFFARYEKNRWRIERPIRAPGESAMLNGLLGDLAELQAVDGPDGFAADDVTDLAPYGLVPPRLTIELTPAGLIRPDDVEPRIAHLGAAVPGVVDRYFALREGEDDVMVIEATGIETLGLDATAVRSKQVLQMGPDDFEALRLTLNGHEHALVRSGKDWEVLSPASGTADAATVGQLLSVLGSMETAEFLPAESGRDEWLETAPLVVEVWERDARGQAVAASTLPNRQADATLRAGPFLASIRGRYARMDGDVMTTLLLPATLNDVLPNGPLAFRDRTLADDDPRSITRIELRRASLPPTVLETANQGLDWEIIAPARAPADPLVVRAMAVVLANLRAESWEGSEDRTTVGIVEPNVLWTVEARGLPPIVKSLRIGGSKGRDGGRSAWLDDLPDSFVLPSAAVATLVAEPRVRRLMSFDPRLVERLEIRTSAEVVEARREGSSGGWLFEPEVDWLDSDDCEGLARALGSLSAIRFLQYGGPIDARAGLSNPSAMIAAFGAKGVLGPVLRIGGPFGNAEVVGAMGDGATGAVFTLPRSVLEFVPRSPELPAELFAP